MHEAKYVLCMFEFTPHEKLELAYLIHDKSHVAAHGKRINALETAFELFSDVCRVPLFRGINDYDDKIIDNNEKFTLPGYTSFSENLDFVHNIAVRRKTNRVLKLNHGNGFSYWKWYRSDLEKLELENPEEFNAIDGEFLIETLEEELEWILPRNSTFRVLSKTMHDNVELISIEQV